MRPRISVVVAILALSEAIAGQKANDELAELRQLLGVPASTPITKANASALPAERPLKIYVSTAGDPDALNQVTRLIRQIAEKDASKYGAVVVVQTVSEAGCVSKSAQGGGERTRELAPFDPSPFGGQPPAGPRLPSRVNSTALSP